MYLLARLFVAPQLRTNLLQEVLKTLNHALHYRGSQCLRELRG